MRIIKPILFAILLVSISSKALTYDKVALEIRSNYNFVTDDIQGLDVNTGYGVEVALNYNFMEQLGVYVGWGWNHFTLEASNTNDGFVFDETGFNFGLQYIKPIGDSEELSYLVKAGGIYNQVIIEPESSGSREFGPQLGWEFCLGIQYGIGKAWFIRPQLSYSSLTGDYIVSGRSYDFKLNYIAFGLGIAKSF